MIHVIRFCACKKVDKDNPDEDRQCMVFSFTPKALKILSKDFLDMITGKKGKNVGIELPDDNDKKFVHIKKTDTNLYRIPTNYIDPFIRCLFKYLPGHFLSEEERNSAKCEF